MHPGEQNLVSHYLGQLSYLSDIEPNESIINALVQVWDPKHSVFRFGDYELTVTPEEIAGFLGLSLEGKSLIFPTTSSKKDFSDFTGLKETAIPGPLQANSIEIKCLYNYFASRECFSAQRNDFFLNTEDTWAQKRIWVYGFVLAGFFLFPRPDNKVNIRIVKMLSDLFHGIDGRELTIVPTIVADIFVACNKCKRKPGFFYGPSIILQAWAVEHLTRRSAIQSGLVMKDTNWIQSHNRRVSQPNQPGNMKGYMELFDTLRQEDICWVLEWTECHKPALQSSRRKFIPLLGSNGVAPYIPQRVLRQFGRIQGIPPELQTNDFDVIFPHGVCPKEIPKKLEIAEAWGSRCTDQNIPFDPKTKSFPKTTPGYDAWLKGQDVYKGQAVVNLTEENDRLRALLDAKDRELIQEKQVSKNHKEAYDSLKELYTETKQDQREKKRKCLELTDNIQRAMNRYSRESDRSKAQRYEDQLQRTLESVKELVG